MSIVRPSVLVEKRHRQDNSAGQRAQRRMEGAVQAKAESSDDVLTALDGGAWEMTDDTRDRIIRVESNMAHMERQLSEVQFKVSQMHDLLMQVKGMRLLIVGMAAVSCFLTALATKYIPFFR